VAEWLLENRIAIVNYSASLKEPLDSLPPYWWWVVIAVVKAVTDYVNPVFVKLQGKTLLISQQTAILAQLADELTILAGIDGPFNDEQIEELAAGFNTTYGRWSIAHENVFLFINDQGMFVRNTFDELSSEDQDDVVYHVGKLLVTLVEGIRDIQAERDSRNRATDDLPPVLPHELVKLRTAEFGRTIVDKHLQQLRHSWSDETINKIEQQHRQLCLAYQHDSILKAALDNCQTGSTSMSFESGWKIVQGRFDVLRDFCGGIATVQANTATVESDFSILGWEKDEHRQSLSDLSLEGIMQSKQYELLANLV
jgi:hypothetical protein